MRQKGIRLHLPKSNTSCTLPPLHRLVCNRVNGTGCTNLEGKGGEGRGREERGREGRRGEERGGEEKGVEAMLVCWVAVCRWWQHLKLVRHHVVQALIVDVAHKDVRLQLLSIDTTVHSVVAIVIVPTCAVRYILYFCAHTSQYNIIVCVRPTNSLCK